MNAPAWRLHPLTGNLAGHWAAWVNGNWRMTFRCKVRLPNIKPMQRAA
jgi:plasmid maintenance system killer protein